MSGTPCIEIFLCCCLPNFGLCSSPLIFKYCFNSALEDRMELSSGVIVKAQVSEIPALLGLNFKVFARIPAHHPFPDLEPCTCAHLFFNGKVWLSSFYLLPHLNHQHPEGEILLTFLLQFTKLVP